MLRSEPQEHGEEVEALCGIRTLVATTDWDDMTRRLILYAAFRTSRYGKATSFYQGYVDDYVQEAVKLFLTERRRYIPRPRFTLYRFLCSVIDSLVSHQAEKVKRQKQVVIAEEDDDATSLTAVPEDRLASAGDFERDLMLRDEMESLINSLEPDLQTYARLQMTVERTASEYAAMLNISEAKVRNMDRRIHRRRKEWLRKTS